MRTGPWLLVLMTALGAAAAPLRVLLLSGSNNHDWRATTPVLKEAIEAGGASVVTVETNVAGMTAASFEGFDAIVSNFNTFGRKDTGPVWDAPTRAAFLAHVRAGHGFVGVHAGTSVFADWPEFQALAGGTWGKGTSHGAIHSNIVTIVDTNHPITRELSNFATADEFWQDVPLAPGAKVLAEVVPARQHRGSGKAEPMALITESGQARGFFLVLGHHVQAMQNEGFQALLRRGVHWVAGAQDAEGTK